MSVRFLTFDLCCLEAHFCMSHRNVSRLDYLYVSVLPTQFFSFFFSFGILSRAASMGRGTGSLIQPPPVVYHHHRYLLHH